MVLLLLNFIKTTTAIIAMTMMIVIVARRREVSAHMRSGRAATRISYTSRLNNNGTYIALTISTACS